MKTKTMARLAMMKLLAKIILDANTIRVLSYTKPLDCDQLSTLEMIKEDLTEIAEDMENK